MSSYQTMLPGSESEFTQQGSTYSQSATTAISQLVAFVAIEAKETKQVVYGRIFARLEALYGLNVYRCPRSSNESLLSVAERYGWLNEVYAIAYAEHLYLLSYEE